MSDEVQGKVILIAVNEEPRGITVPDTKLETLQNLVGGLIQLTHFAPGVALIVHEEARLVGSRDNLVVPGWGPNSIAGDCVLVKDEGEEFGTFADLEVLHWGNVVNGWQRRRSVDLPERSMEDFSRCPICWDTDCFCSDVIPYIYV